MSVIQRGLRLGIVLALALACSGCIGPNHATARLAKVNHDIENKWLRQGAFMVMLPGYLLLGLGDNFIFNSIFWWTGSNPIDPPRDDEGPEDFGW